MEKLRFVASYSGGKDGALAILRAKEQGHEPVSLLTTYNTGKGRSWFHGVPHEVLEGIAESAGLPLITAETYGEDYAERFEQALIKAKDIGANACVFGDIDIEEHKRWCTARCDSAGLIALFPLWGEGRKVLVREGIDRGFTARITIIDTRRMDAGYLGQTLSHELVERLEQDGVDVCGENGEYHTFVTGGPIFKGNISYRFGQKIVDNGYAILPIIGKDE